MERPSLGLVEDIVWVAIKLQPLNNKTTQYYLELAYSQLDSIKLYELQGDSLEHVHSTGDSYFFDQRPIIHRHFVFPMSLSAEAPKTFLLRLETTGSMQFPLYLWAPKVILEP